ncbi:hypothetical protein ABFS83_11G073200 [Erythranthe nasuta]
MKLLGWMHRKFRQNSCETPKDHFSNGQAYLDDLHCYNGGTGNNNCKPFSKTQRYRRNSFTSLESARDDHDNNLNNEDRELTEQTSESDMAEIFHGFLAIGTLGSHEFAAAATDNDAQDDEEDNDYYPSTPRFTMDNIAEKQTQEAITENELKLINDELEKVLNIGDDDDIASSGRNSHVSSSAGRFSHVSSITLSGNNNRISDVCPLQSYLLGTAAAATTTETAAAVKKEQRTSLGELFQKTKQAEEMNSGVKSERDKSAVRLVKKMLKKKIVHAIDSETKLNKILQIFNRKVHPENYSAEESACNNKKDNKIINDDEMMMKNSESVPLVSCNNNYSGGTIRRSSSAEDIIIYPDQHPIINKNANNIGNEFWVKTDSDYLVLEL